MGNSDHGTTYTKPTQETQTLSAARNNMNDMWLGGRVALAPGIAREEALPPPERARRCPGASENRAPTFCPSHFASRISSQSRFAWEIGATCLLTMSVSD
jgi:hypothetical protein